MAEYISTTPKRTRIKRGITKPLALLFIALVAFTGAVSGSTLVKHEQASADIVSDFICEAPDRIPWLAWAGPEEGGSLLGEESITHTIYRGVHTDDLAFALESKSAVSSGTEDVDGLYNFFINLGRAGNFSDKNSTVLGVDLETGAPLEGVTPNSGPRLTAYDRFGLAGLSWTRYNGEWRYPFVDVCNSAEPRDLKLGVLYSGRLEPLTTRDGIQDTKDVRTSQFGEGIAANLGEGFLNTTANWAFAITKTIVTAAIVLVNLSFSDIVGLLQLDELIGSDTGIFANLYMGIYQPFIGLVFVAVGLLMLYKGVIKREFRGALGLLFRSIALFVLALFMFASPLFFVTLPNNVAVVIQSLIVNAMGTSMASGSGICTTTGTESQEVETNSEAPADITNAGEAQDLLTLASENMRSVVGCQLWSTFLVKPWSLGQFGVDYNKLYADGFTPAGAYGETGEVQVDNGWMVGDAAVPVGNGDYINNWALFHISTGTNAHAPVVEANPEVEGGISAGLSTYTNGVANDWYRIVDALSNYNERESEIQDDITASNNSSPIDTIRFSEPDTDKVPTEYWSTWVGGNSIERIGIALTSILGASAGLLTVVIFGFLSVVYSFGLIIVMTFAPLFLLAGSWGNRGWDIFKSWAQLLLNLVVKKVVIGFILVLNLVLLTTVLNMMSDQDYFWGVAVLAILSVMLWKFKEKIVDTVGGLFTFSFANQNMESKLSQTTGQLRGNVKKVTAGLTNIGVASVAGGIAAKRNGAGFISGSGSGFFKELKNQAYLQDSDLIRSAIRVNETLGTGLDAGEICPYCGQTLASVIGTEGEVRTDEDGNKWHIECAEEKYGGPDNIPPKWTSQYVKINQDGSSKEREKVTRRVKSATEKIDSNELRDSLSMNENARNPGTIVGEALSVDFAQKDGIPSIPGFLEKSLRDNRHVIDQAFRSGDKRELEAIVYLYAQAVAEYAYAEGLAEVGDYSFGPSSGGSAESDVQAIYSDMMREIK